MADIIINPGSSIMSFTSSLNYTQTLTQDASGSLILAGSGSTGRTDLFTVNGNNGTLFSVSDDLSDSLFSVNTIAGLPVIEAFANNNVVMGQYGQNVLVVTGSNVGIGTSNPASYSNIVALTIGDNNSTKVGLLKFRSNYNSGDGLEIYQNGSGLTYINTNSGTVAANITSGGNIGIGTTNPSSKLHLYGTTTLLTITDTTYGRTSEIGYLDSANLYLANDNGGNTYIGRYNNIFLAYGGGNVGVGTTSATAKLDVVGGTLTGGTESTYALRIKNGASNKPLTFGSDSSNTYIQSWGSAPLKINNEGNAIEFGGNATFNGTYTNVNSSYITVGNNSTDVVGISDNTMYFPGNGNVGIGITNPGNKLEIRNGGGSTGYSGNDLVIYNANGQSAFYHDSAGYVYWYTNQAITFYPGASRSVTFATNGRVGIGSTSPNVKLDVVGTGHFGSPSTSDEGLGIYSAGGSGDYSRIRFYQSSTNIHTIHSFSTNWQSGTIYNSSTGALNFSGQNGITIGPWNDPDAIFVSSGATYLKGSVGIGTTSPSYKLHVNTNSAVADLIGMTNGTQTLTLGVNNTAGGSFLFENSSNALRFGTAGSERMRIASAGNVGIGTTSPSSLLDVAGYLTTSDGNLELYKSYTVDMSNTGTYSTSNYYPVIIPIGTEPVQIQVQVNLNSNVPSWATHPAGFTLNVRWITNGSGWGTTQIKRKVYQYHENWASTTICGGITQMSQSSTEVIYLRGGGTYFFKLSRSFTPSPQSSTYTSNGQSVSPTSTAVNTIWNSASGAETYYAGDIYANTFYDNGNASYYLDPASSSNLYTGIFSGVVGIGTATPNGKLAVNAGVSGTPSWNNNTIEIGAESGLTAALAFHRYGYTVSTIYSDDGSIVMNLGSTEVMRITGGNVGISTNSPSAKLDIRSSASSGATNAPTFRAFGLDTDSYFEVNNNANNSADIKLTRSDAATMFKIDGHSGVTYFAGDVGIGTTSPTTKLHVETTESEDGIKLTNSGTTKVIIYNGGLIDWGNAADFGQVTWDTGKAIVQGKSGKALSLGANSTPDYLWIATGGNVGIGNTNPSYKLDVSGDVGVSGAILDSSNNYLYWNPGEAYFYAGGRDGNSDIQYTPRQGIASISDRSEMASTWGGESYYNGQVLSKVTAHESISRGALVYLRAANGKWAKADAIAVSSTKPLLGIALDNVSADGNFSVLLDGMIITSYHAQTGTASPGAPLYVATSNIDAPGYVTQDVPTSSGEAVRLIGHNIYDTTSGVIIRFQPDNTWIEL